MNLLMCLRIALVGYILVSFGFLHYAWGVKKALRVGRTRMLVPHPCKSRHQREEEHLRVLILSSLESPLLAPRTGENRSFTFRGITNLVRLNR